MQVPEWGFGLIVWDIEISDWWQEEDALLLDHSLERWKRSDARSCLEFSWLKLVIILSHVLWYYPLCCNIILLSMLIFLLYQRLWSNISIMINQSDHCKECMVRELLMRAQTSILLARSATSTFPWSRTPGSTKPRISWSCLKYDFARTFITVKSSKFHFKNPLKELFRPLFYLH